MSLLYQDGFDFYTENLQYIFAETETDYIILRKRGKEFYKIEKKFSKSKYQIKKVWYFPNGEIKDQFIILLSEDEKDELITYKPKKEDSLYFSYEIIENIIEKTEEIQEIAPLLFFAKDKKQLVSINKEGKIHKMDFSILLGSCKDMLENITIDRISEQKWGIDLDLGTEDELHLILSLSQEEDESRLSPEIITAGITDELLITNLPFQQTYNFQTFIVEFQDSEIYSHILGKYQEKNKKKQDTKEKIKQLLMNKKNMPENKKETN